MLQLIEQLQDIANKENLKFAPEISFFMLFTIEYHGQEIRCKTINQLNPNLLQVKKVLLQLQKPN